MRDLTTSREPTKAVRNEKQTSAAFGEVKS